MKFLHRETNLGWSMTSWEVRPNKIVGRLFLNPFCRFYSYKGNSNNDNYEPEITV